MIPRPRAIDWLLLFPLLAPLALLAAGNDSFGFDSPGHLDSFLYVGYFWHYPEHLPVFDEYYKISRLTWVIPGYLAHRFGAIVGTYVLMYATLASGAAGAYLTVREATRDRIAATVTGVAWACCSWGHGSGGWNYHILAAASWYLLGSWLMMRAARGDSSRWWALGGGACLAAAIHAHLFLIVFTPLLLLVYVAALREHGVWSPVQVRRGVLDAIGGGLLLTAALAFVNAATGGEWLFFMPQIRYTIWLGTAGNNSWWLRPGEWVPSSTYLVLPVLFLLLGAVALARRPSPRPPVAVALVVQAWGAFALLCFFQFVRHQTVLDHDYQAFILYVPTFVCTGAVALARPSGATSHRSAPVVAAIASASMVGVLLFLTPSPVPHALTALETSRAVARALGSAVPPLVGGLVGIALTAATSGTMRVFAFVVWFSIVNAWVSPDLSMYGVGSKGINRQMLTLFVDADRFTTSLDPSLRGIKYWFSSEEMATPFGRVGLTSVFDSFVATRGWLGNLLGLQSPGAPIEKLTVENLKEGPCLGVLTSVGAHEKFLREIEGHFASLNQPLARVAARRFEQPLVSFALTVYRPAMAPQRTDNRPTCLTR